MDHLKFFETTENKEVEKSVLITAQIYAKTLLDFVVNKRLIYFLLLYWLSY
jgi:hypothetical protein